MRIAGSNITWETQLLRMLQDEQRSRVPIVERGGDSKPSYSARVNDDVIAQIALPLLHVLAIEFNSEGTGVGERFSCFCAD